MTAKSPNRPHTGSLAGPLTGPLFAPVFAPVLVLAIALAAPQEAAAQRETRELEALEEQLKDQAEEERRLREEAKAREKEIAALRHNLIETAHALQEAERKITALEASIADLEAEKGEAQSALDVESGNLSDVLAALQSLELSRPPALLVTPQDANQAARAAMLLSEAAPALEARAARLRAAIDRLNSLSAALDRDKTALVEANRELSARRDVLTELTAQKEKERDVAARLAAAAQKESARLAARATTLRDLLRRLERLAHSVTPRLKPPPPAPQAPALARPASPPSIKRAPPQPYQSARRFADARGALRPPVAGRLIGEFGKVRPEGGRFEGMRFVARDQAIVTAPFEGRIVFAMGWEPVGNMIVLDVGGGYHIVFKGVGAIMVQESQRIAAGEPIAQMTDGGASLDLEIRKNGEPVNPALWLSSKTVEDPAF